jgi:hypothetical protein
MRTAGLSARSSELAFPYHWMIAAVAWPTVSRCPEFAGQAACARLVSQGNLMEDVSAAAEH